MLRTLLRFAPLLPLLGAVPAMAQMDSREGIALQNQILQLRQEVEALRQQGGGGYPAPVPMAPPARAGASAGSPELLTQLLDRVSSMEEEVRRLRGRVEESDYRIRTNQQALEKLQGDMDYRLQQLEQGGGAARPASPAPRPQQRGEAEVPASPAANAAPRTAERALADGQAALSRRDYNTAAAAAREVIGARNTARMQDAQLLLGEALLGQREYQNAALAFDDAYRRNRSGARAPEALVGLSSAFLGFGAKREACATLDDLRSQFPKLSGSLAQRAADARQRGGCR
ncbi:YbgF trimerization domain-containing protein [Roseomonas sp. E05]|uniref:YbgF trimerization domain-containing protein n=1 Tax=Roseomonas sp. E05 TaxID=3046310 RepID=UPI0024BB6D50|nr:YbgF trimerization domain-containing protein [Roseomonas sp. E05]MDJ0389889.1 YbgF trimerization domain-containing protein [Roseomonas sp. E05]